MPIEETIEAFQNVVQKGKARYLGFSEWTPEQITAAIEFGGSDHFISSQPEYSMLWRAVDRLQPIADDAGLTLPHLALAWLLRRPEVASANTGATRPEQVHANAAASGITLSADVLKAVNEALGDAPVTESTLAPFARHGVKHREHQLNPPLLSTDGQWAARSLS